MRKWPLVLALGALAWSGFAQTEPAQPGAVPEPAPTNAVQSLAGSVQVEGYGNLPLADSEAARLEAYQAAVLDAYQQLFWRGAEQMDLLPHGQAGEFRSFRIGAEHPNPVLLAWLLRAEVLSQQVTGRRLRVKVQSPPLADLASEEDHGMRTQPVDLDQDGKAESELLLTVDGRVRLRRAVPPGRFQILATSSPLNSFACNVLRTREDESWEQVQLRRAVGFSGVEVLPGQKLRVLVDLTLGESVDEWWIGKAREQREVLLRWDDPAAAPDVEIQEPQDFSTTQKSQVAWKALLETPAGLEVAKLRVNGRPFWQTPETLAKKERLRMDILLPLLPGVNRAQVSVSDQSRRAATRELLLYREAPCPGLGARQRRALLIGVSEYAAAQFPPLRAVPRDLERMRSMLQKTPGGGFPARNITVLSGAQATRRNILEALARASKPEGEERVYLFVYFAGLSTAGGGGKSLLPYDARGFDQGAISASELEAATGDLKQADIVLLADTSQSRLETATADRLWLDSQEFAESLARDGWGVISSVDGLVEKRDSENGSRLLGAFLEACSARGDANGDGFVEWDEAYKQLFQGLQLSSPGTALPLRRGELLGRVPLSVTR